jgi:hypothetical protein
MSAPTIDELLAGLPLDGADPLDGYAITEDQAHECCGRCCGLCRPHLRRLARGRDML